MGWEWVDSGEEEFVLGLETVTVFKTAQSKVWTLAPDPPAQEVWVGGWGGGHFTSHL